MKHTYLLAIIAAAVILGGCSGKKDASAGYAPVVEKIDQAGTGAENPEAAQAAPGTEAESAEAENADAESAEAEGADAAQQAPANGTAAEGSSDKDDYASRIRSEIAGIAESSGSLSKELVSVNELYDKYDELTTNAPDQASMNVLCQWGTEVWKDETVSLRDRIRESDPADAGDILAEYENWENHIPSMAEKMSYEFEGGSIYPMMYSYNEAMRYKRMAYVLASTLADISGELDFVFPDSTRCGYYGDYAGDSYLLITEGMESGSYNILIHIDDTKELRGWGTVEDAPDSDTYLVFTSDDGSVKGNVAHSTLEASFYPTETDGSVIGPEGAYTFSFKY